MPLTLLFTSSAERNALIQCNVVTDLRGLSDHDTVTVVDKQSPADRCAGMDLNAGLPRSTLRDPARQQIMPLQIMTVRSLISPLRAETRIQENFKDAVDRRIFFPDHSRLFFK